MIQSNDKRIDELLARANGHHRCEWLRAWEGCDTRAAVVAVRNGAKDASDVLAAINSGEIRNWKMCGPVAIRALCAYVAAKFPTDPPPPPAAA